MPTCDVRRGRFSKWIVTAYHTHTWWYNTSPFDPFRWIPNGHRHRVPDAQGQSRHLPRWDDNEREILLYRQDSAALGGTCRIGFMYFLTDSLNEICSRLKETAPSIAQGFMHNCALFSLHFVHTKVWHPTWRDQGAVWHWHSWIHWRLGFDWLTGGS